MRLGFFVALGIAAVVGLVVMLLNFVERPTNESGRTGPGYNAQQSREWHPRWPPENERLSHKFRRWWEW